MTAVQIVPPKGRAHEKLSELVPPAGHSTDGISDDFASRLNDPSHPVLKPYGTGWNYHDAPRAFKLEDLPKGTVIVGKLSFLRDLEAQGVNVLAFTHEDLGQFALPVVGKPLTQESREPVFGFSANELLGCVLFDRVFLKPDLTALYESLVSQRNRVYRRWCVEENSFRSSAENREQQYRDCSALHRAALGVGMLLGTSTVESNYHIACKIDSTREIAGLKLGRIGKSQDYEELMFPPIRSSFTTYREFTSQVFVGTTRTPGEILLEKIAEHKFETPRHRARRDKFNREFEGIATLSLQQSELTHRYEGVGRQATVLSVRHGHFERVRTYLENL